MRALRYAFAALAAALALGHASAQSEFPNKAVKVIVPFPAGGVTDVGARIVTDKMSQLLAVPIIIDNKPGAGSKLGTGLAVKAPKDGYTLYMGNSSYAILPVIDEEAGYDAESDLKAVGTAATYGMSVVVNTANSAKSMSELVALAKKSPGALTYGSAGPGSGAHFMGEHLKELTGTDMLHVPFKSTAHAVQEVAAGRVDVAFDGAVKPFVDAGKVRILAVTSKVRDPRFPQVPTVAEAGLPQLTFVAWLGLFAPAGTPDVVVAKVNRALNEALSDPSVKERLAALGLTADGGAPAVLAEHVRADLLKHKKIAADTRMTLK